MTRDFSFLPDEGFDGDQEELPAEELLHVEVEGEEMLPDLHDDDDLDDDDSLDEVTLHESAEERFAAPAGDSVWHHTVETRLRHERERLLRVRSALEVDHLDVEAEEEAWGELSHLDQHPADVASDVYERTRELSVLRRVDEELAELGRAHERLDDGTYGHCEQCGRRISRARLEALPAARFCLDHEHIAETMTERVERRR